jgi:hypothetical protein
LDIDFFRRPATGFATNRFPGKQVTGTSRVALPLEFPQAEQASRLLQLFDKSLPMDYLQMDFVVAWAAASFDGSALACTSPGAAACTV